ncbi:MAG: adenine phosphoribosyltransferase [Ignavibacteriae bacterium]|nr:adenine phosphoribosyltransferase [Ignavibacteriota bacterium]
MTTTEISSSIRSIPDFPKKGIVFRDITTLLKDPHSFACAIDAFYERYKDEKIAKVVSIESRGFVFGAPLAYKLGAGFVPVRKPKKLPAETIREEYALEYGTDAVEIHKDAIAPGERVLIIDDLLATGGTVLAAAKLVERLGGQIAGLAFLIELSFLKARARLSSYQLFTLVDYQSE